MAQSMNYYSAWKETPWTELYNSFTLELLHSPDLVDYPFCIDNIIAGQNSTRFRLRAWSRARDTDKCSTHRKCGV